MKTEDKISRQQFERIDLQEFNEKEVLRFFQDNPNTAFSFEYLKKKFNLKKSWVYGILRTLRKADLVEKRKKYYILKEQK